MSDNDFSLVGQASSTGTEFSKYYSSFGKVRITQILQKNDGGVWSVIKVDEYLTLPDYNKDAAKGTPYRSIKLTFDLDESKEISILAGRDPEKSFDYRTRSMNVGDNDYQNLIEALEALRGKPFPSVKSPGGKAAREKQIAEELTKLQGLYVESEDRPQMRWNKETKRVEKVEKEAGSGTYWTTFYPVVTYKSKDEIIAAVRARYNKSGSGVANGSAPTPAPTRTYERPDSETEKAWPRTMATIQKRLGRGDDPQAIADDLEIELRYVEQFMTESPLPF